MASSRKSSQTEAYEYPHRHSSFSSSTSNIEHDHSLEHSPLDSPNGSVTSVGHTDTSSSKPLYKSSSMEFHYHDESESDGNISGEPPPDQKLTKRDIHSINEQKRRDLIKNGYAHLLDLVPTCRPSSAGNRPSRAVILQRTIDYIMYLHSQAIKQQDQVEELEKEVKALSIMKENYEQIARAHQNTAATNSQQLPDYVKFIVFRGIADQLFQSFNSSIDVTSFDTLSSCIINWLEECCKPQTLREIVLSNLRVDTLKLQQQSPQTSGNTS
ncbi:PREDICTED: max-like protein X [Amphimedon queenslandica]|uniref:BHLH domain-containing protein n=1 Tax=Amphimedon queenslandica TaxID=400682 RepID=A0A1X7V8W9_AMPQE|nr:PREDICTED: max-like protein X [Amphimedon queenslandica]|eukprot:XP_003385283.1 PREDICTED: max-like protein X [Amphimedon queenslandica]